MNAAVVLMAYGSPERLSDVPAYYADIRGGRPIAPENLADLVERYRRLGIEDSSPLNAITEQTRAALEGELELPVFTGMKHWTPRIAEAVESALESGAEEIVGLVLAPHYSRFSVGEYADRAAKTGAECGLVVDTVESWHLLTAYVDFLSSAVREALALVPEGSEVVFTAHSLPQRILGTGDPYPQQLTETAAAVASRLGLDRWSIGWQSAGRTPEPWLGPDVLEIVRTRREAGATGLVVCACGFVADHLEVAYDLDIEAAGVAADIGLVFARTASVNADARVMAALAGLVAER
jgi:protoporphyrin/coproporphyrin ferrochelatase